VKGVDLSRRCLDRGRAGAYGEQAFRSVEGRSLRRWFQLRDGRWVVDDALRCLVELSLGNLHDGAGLPAGPFDVILCRNVLLYLDLAARRRVLRNLHDRLAGGGWLLLGHAESLLEPGSGLEPVHLDRALVFRRPFGGAEAGR
jgi:chemotaxis protein methyltransferase CheR